MNESLVDRLPPIIDIGPERQLFLDDLLIDSLENAARFVHQPVKSAENPVFAMEKPWEGQRFLYCDLAVDSETGHYKLWYSIYPKVGHPGLCYAVSEDGVHFERPELGRGRSGRVEGQQPARPARGLRPRHVGDAG